jgi:hypothetical protein
MEKFVNSVQRLILAARLGCDKGKQIVELIKSPDIRHDILFERLEKEFGLKIEAIQTVTYDNGKITSRSVTYKTEENIERVITV